MLISDWSSDVCSSDLGATGLISSSAVAAVAQSDDLGVLQTSLALEHEGIAAYQIAGQSGLLSPDTLKVALTFMGHHQEHRSEERSVGKERVGTCRFRLSRYHYKKK